MNLYEQREELFTHIVEELSNNQDVYETIPNILSRICNFFSYSNGFIYEADHTGRLELKEHVEEDKVRIPTEFLLSSILTPEEIEKMKHTFLYATKEKAVQANNKFAIELLSLFQMNTFLINPLLNQKGELIGIVGIGSNEKMPELSAEDLSVARSVLMVISNHVKLRVYQTQIKLARNSLSSTLDNTGVDIYVNDFLTHEILYVNKSMAKPYGGVECLMGKKCYEALYNGQTEPCEYCPQLKIIDENGEPTKVYSWDYQRPFDGSWFRVFSAAFKWVDGRLAHVVSSVDITENKKYEFLVERMAYYDALTNIPNRRKFDKDFEDIINKNDQSELEGYLLFIDLDKFKYVNDYYGHEKGDELLRQIAYYFDQNPLTKNKCYRYGGDEFILLFDQVDYEGINAILDKIVERFLKPWNLKEIDLICSCSIGIAHYPSDGLDSSSLIHNADTAMYHIKRKGNGHVEFYKNIKE